MTAGSAETKIERFFDKLLAEARYFHADFLKINSLDSVLEVSICKLNHKIKTNHLSKDWYTPLMQVMQKGPYVIEKKSDSQLDVFIGKALAESVSKDEIKTDSPTEERLKNEKPTIMLVEDDADQREILNLMLKDLDYEVVAAQDGEQAIEMLKGLTPDLIISDLMMPKVDGTEFVKQIKSRNEFRHIPILILTVISDPEKEFNLLSLGVNDFCQKTVQRKILLQRIQNLIKRDELEDGN